MDFLEAHVTHLKRRLTEIELKRDEIISHYDGEISAIMYEAGFHAKLISSPSDVLPKSEKPEDKDNDAIMFFENMFKNDTKHFLICDSVYKAAELIKIGENFTGRTLKDIAIGGYTYLMGKTKMLRFRVFDDRVIQGIYWNKDNGSAFSWSVNSEEGDYYHEQGTQEEFSMIMRLMTFIELGDIEVTIIDSGKNNHSTNFNEKVHNSSNNTVYVVDSSWNKLIIRTEGFAVRGHFKLQPCGPQNKDRKLIWVNAFEKHGYTRRPKAEILHC